MSEEVWKHLQSVAGGVSFSSQFLYLYGYGYQAEMEAGVRTAAGSTLADYAAAHPNEVSLYDLYMNLYRKASQAAEYMWTWRRERLCRTVISAIIYRTEKWFTPM